MSHLGGSCSSAGPRHPDFEFCDYSDDAWYSVHLVYDGRRLIVKFLNFSDEHDRVFNPGFFSSLKQLEEFENRFRHASVQLQDRDCSTVVKGTRVCASHSFAEKDNRFYDAVVEEVKRRQHSFQSGEEECRCNFLLLWQNGPNVGNLVAKSIESICLVHGSTQKAPQVVSFVEMTSRNIQTAYSQPCSVSNAVVPAFKVIESASPHQSCLVSNTMGPVDTSDSSFLKLKAKYARRFAPGAKCAKRSEPKHTAHEVPNDKNACNNNDSPISKSKSTIAQRLAEGTKCANQSEPKQIATEVRNTYICSSDTPNTKPKSTFAQRLALGISAKRSEPKQKVFEVPNDVDKCSGDSRIRRPKSTIVQRLAQGTSAKWTEPKQKTREAPNNTNVHVSDSPFGKLKSKFSQPLSQGINCGKLSESKQSASGGKLVSERTDQDADMGGVGCSYIILINNLEKELSPLTIKAFIHKQTAIASQACVFPSSSSESFASGAIVLEREEDFNELNNFLDNDNHMVTSSRGRPWIVTEKLVRRNLSGVSISTLLFSSKDKLISGCSGFSKELKVVHSGTEAFRTAVKLKDLFKNFASHQEHMHKKLMTEETRILLQFQQG